MFRFLSENFVLKVIALATSLMIWFYASEERNPIVTKRVNAAVRVVGTAPPDLLVRVSTDPVPVDVSGPRNEVDALSDTDVKARVSQSLIRAGDHQVPISGFDRPPSAPDITVQALQQTVPASVTRKLSKRLRVEAAFNNDAPLGRVYSMRPRLDPAYATVIGSREDLDRVVKLRVYVETHGGSVHEDLPILALDHDDVRVDSVQLEPDRTHVELDLVEAPASRTLIINPVITGRPAPPYGVAEVLVKPDQVTVIGKPEQLLQLSNVATAPVLLDGLTSDVSRETPLRLPEGVRLRGQRQTVLVTVRLRDLGKSGADGGSGAPGHPPEPGKRGPG